MAEPTFLDRVIGWYDPVRGLRRSQARNAMGVARAYEAARPRRQDDGWLSPSTGPNSEVGSGLVVMRNRARQMVRDNPFAKRVVDVLQSSLIGAGVVTQAASDDDKLNQKMQKHWKAWAGSTKCDADGRLNLYGIQALCGGSMFESGEVLIRLRWRSKREMSKRKLSIPLQLQVIEADYLDHTKNETTLPNGGFVVQGVEFDKRGYRVAYWVFTQHPGEYYRTGVDGVKPVRIPASEIIHLYEVKRPGQVRGVTCLHAAMTMLRDLQDYHQALLMKAKVESCFGVFVRGSGNDNPVTGSTSSDSNGNRVETIEPGLINYLDQAESVEFANPSNSDAHSLLSKTFMRALGVATGPTYDQVSGDLEGANYSSLRAGKIEFRRIIEQKQWSLFIPTFCEPVWDAFVRAGVLASLWDGDEVPAEHTPPAHEMIDPGKDLSGLLLSVRAGFKSWPQAVREQGSDPRTLAAEIAKANELIDTLGLVLESDPRKTSRTGIAQSHDDGSGKPSDIEKD